LYGERFVRLGDFELLPLSDGSFRLDGGAMFGVVPRTLWSKRTAPDERNRIPLGLRPLLVRTGSLNVLIDAGIGDKMSGKALDIYGVERGRHLDHALEAAGLTAADIDVAIASHLHFDHVGGFTTLDAGVVRPRFPRARVFVRHGEWEDATHPHERNRASYVAEDFVPLSVANVVEFFDDDTELLPGIRACRTGGHTRHHQIIRIESGGRTAVFAADLIPTVAHLDTPWIMAYDLYPMETLEFKRRFLREAIAGEYVIFFEHDPSLAAGIIREADGRRWVEPVLPAS
jgi:glyoxylase-like metal-dependent hydrolase (beta-lactamase superfamily II)